MNDKFLTSCGHYGIDFSQIDKIKLIEDDKEYTYGSVVTLYTKNSKYPIVVLPYQTPDKARYVYKQLQAVVNTKTPKVLFMDNYRKD